MTWIRVDDTLASHPKVWRLQALTGDPAAALYVIQLWLWAARYAADGDLGSLPAVAIAKAAGWHGDPVKFLDDLVAAGFVDCDADGLTLHDWHDYQGAIRDKAERDRARMEALRAAQRADSVARRSKDALATVALPSSDDPATVAGESRDSRATVVRQSHATVRNDTKTEQLLTPPPPLGAGGVAAVPAAPGQAGQDNSEGNDQGATPPPAPAPPPATPAKVAKPKAPPAPRRPLPVFAPELLAAIPDLAERWTRRIACTKPARRPTPSAEQSNVDRIAGWLATYGLDAVLAAIDQATDGGYMAVVEPKAGWKPAAPPSRPVGTPSPVPQAPAAAPLDQLRKQAHRREYSRALEGLRPGELPPANVADALLAALEAATTPEAIAAVTLERVVAAELRAALPTLTPAQILSVGPLPPRRAAVDFAAIPAPPADNQAAAAIAALGLGD